MVRDAVRDSCILGAVVSAALALLGWPQLAISVALGTLLGAINFVLLARSVSGAIDRTVAEVERTQRERGELPNSETDEGDEGLDPEEVVGRPRNAGGALRLAFAVVLIAGLLRFPPTEPMGLAIGVIIVLIGASAAALRHHARDPVHRS